MEIQCTVYLVYFLFVEKKLFVKKSFGTNRKEKRLTNKKQLANYSKYYIRRAKSKNIKRNGYVTFGIRL